VKREVDDAGYDEKDDTTADAANVAKVLSCLAADADRRKAFIEHDAATDDILFIVTLTSKKAKNLFPYNFTN
jgi:hypothetical protein